MNIIQTVFESFAKVLSQWKTKPINLSLYPKGTYAMSRATRQSLTSLIKKYLFEFWLYVTRVMNVTDPHVITSSGWQDVGIHFFIKYFLLKSLDLQSSPFSVFQYKKFHFETAPLFLNESSQSVIVWSFAT